MPRSARQSGGSGCVGLIFVLIFGGVFSGVGGWFTWQYQSVARFGSAPTVEGRVVNIAWSRNSDGDDTCRISVEYPGPDGRPHTYTDPVSKSPCPADRGEQVTMYYDPARPERAVMKSFGWGVLFPGIFLGVGLMTFLFGFGGALWRRR